MKLFCFNPCKTKSVYHRVLCACGTEDGFDVVFCATA
jgi:hypothetical protein